MPIVNTTAVHDGYFKHCRVQTEKGSAQSLGLVLKLNHPDGTTYYLKMCLHENYGLKQAQAMAAKRLVVHIPCLIKPNSTELPDAAIQSWEEFQRYNSNTPVSYALMQAAHGVCLKEVINNNPKSPKHFMMSGRFWEAIKQDLHRIWTFTEGSIDLNPTNIFINNDKSDLGFSITLIDFLSSERDEGFDAKLSRLEDTLQPYINYEKNQTDRHLQNIDIENNVIYFTSEGKKSIEPSPHQYTYHDLAPFGFAPKNLPKILPQHPFLGASQQTNDVIPTSVIDCVHTLIANSAFSNNYDINFMALDIDGERQGVNEIRVARDGHIFDVRRYPEKIHLMPFLDEMSCNPPQGVIMPILKFFTSKSYIWVIHPHKPSCSIKDFFLLPKQEERHLSDDEIAILAHNLLSLTYTCLVSNISPGFLMKDVQIGKNGCLWVSNLMKLCYSAGEVDAHTFEAAAQETKTQFNIECGTAQRADTFIACYDAAITRSYEQPSEFSAAYRLGFSR